MISENLVSRGKDKDGGSEKVSDNESKENKVVFKIQTILVRMLHNQYRRVIGQIYTQPGGLLCPVR